VRRGPHNLGESTDEQGPSTSLAEKKSGLGGGKAEKESGGKWPFNPGGNHPPFRLKSTFSRTTKA